MITPESRWLLAGLLCLALWPGVTRGQSSELMDAYNRLSDLYAQGRYQEALSFAEKALRLGEHEFGLDHPTTATLLDNLAALYHAQGRYAEAEPLHKRSLAIREKALGHEAPDVAKSVNNLALLYRVQGKYPEAEPDDMRLLLEIEKALGPEHPLLAQSLEHYAEVLRETGRDTAAEKLEARAKAIRAKRAEENPVQQ